MRRQLGNRGEELVAQALQAAKLRTVERIGVSAVANLT